MGVLNLMEYQKSIIGKYRNLIDKLNLKKFFGLQKIKIGYTIARVFNSLASDYSNVFTDLKLLLANLLFNLWAKDSDADGDILFFIGTHDPKQKEIFCRLKKLIPKAALISFSFKKSFRLTPIAIFYKVFFIFINSFKLVGLKLNFQTKIVLLNHLLTLKLCNNFLNRCNLKKYKALVTWFDAEACENLCTQIFQTDKKTTITFQHGHFISTKENAKSIEDVGIAFETMISDYFFCWGEFTKNEAIKNGIDESKIVCVGSPNLIGQTEMKMELKRDKNIGVLLTGQGSESVESENVLLIKIANELSQTCGCKYTCRLHPSIPAEKYAEINDSKNYLGNSVQGETLFEFSQKHEQYLVGSSTCFAELLYFKCNVFKIQNSKFNFYENMNYFNISNTQDAIDLANKRNTAEFLNNKDLYAQVLMGHGNIADNYLNALDNILGGQI